VGVGSASLPRIPVVVPVAVPVAVLVVRHCRTGQAVGRGTEKRQC
jgi:hypothetical protein